MKLDPKCVCIDCVIKKMLLALDEIPPNRVKLEEERMRFLNHLYVLQKLNETAGINSPNAIKIIEEIDCYANIDDLKAQIEVLNLVNLSEGKTYLEKTTLNQTLKGLPGITDEQRQRRIYENQKNDNKKTIFDKKEYVWDH